MTRAFSLLVLLFLSSFAAAEDVATITPQALQERLAADGTKPLLVDVRELEEFEGGHIDGAQLAPLDRVEKAMANIAKDREIVLVCRSGRRSANAWRLLSAAGFTRLWNLEGGMNAWEKLGYPVVKK